MTIEFSVIVPTHDRDNLLIQSLNSILNQSYPPKEIIVVDDLGKDSTSNIVQELNKEINGINIFYIVRENFNEFSSPASINLGVSKSKFNYIAILDDDDLWDENYLMEVNKTYEKNSCDMTVCKFKVLKNKKFLFGKFFEEKFDLQNFLSRNPGVICSNVTIKKNIFLKIGGYDPGLIESADRDLFIRVNLTQKKVSYIKFSLVSWRLHEQIVPNKNKRFLISNFRFIKKYRKEISPLSYLVIIIKLFKRVSFNG